MKDMKKIVLLIMLGLIVSFSAFAQQTLKGTIRSKADKQPLPGVSVAIKGTLTGGITDLDGNFSIHVKSGDILVASFIGYKTQEIPVGSRTKMDILLEEDVALLDEVVVVGYGIQKKSDITGSVSSVKSENIRNAAFTRTDEALQGQIAGVQVVNNDASPNSSISIRIRGVNSINAASDPLVIIDGMQGGSMSNVHPNDIESIEILKDASATAIYGSRGAGGVILITTKKGGSQKPVITYNVFGALQQVRKKLDIMNASEYAQYINTNRVVRKLPAVFDDVSVFQNNSTDWQDEIFRTGMTQNHHLSISGKSGIISYNIAGDYLGTKGIVINSKFQKMSLRSNLSIDLNKRIKLNLNTFFSSSKDNPTVQNARDAYGSPIYAALNFAPTRPVYESDGTYSQPGGGYGSNTEYNPVALADEQTNVYRQKMNIINPEIVVQLFKDLKFQSSVSWQMTDGESDWYYTEKVINGGEATRTASISNDKWIQFQNTNMLTYDHTFAGKHHLIATAVLEQQLSKSTSSYASSKGFFTNEKLYNNLGLGNETIQPGSYRADQTLLSYMGRISYTYSDRYSATLTMRADGSSVFAKNNKWGYFPSAGLAWNISNEKFLKNVSVIDNLKLRLSYGVVGNQAISPYQSLDLLVTGSKAAYAFDGEKLHQGVSLSTLAGNPNLKWETTKQWNAGIDLSLFKGRLNLTADAYRKITSDLLFEKQLKMASGQATQLVNAGKIRNQGIELVVGGTPVRTKSFEWTTNLTYAANRSEVLALNEGVDEMILGGAGMPGFSDAVRLEVGQPIGLVKGFRYDGVWKNDEKILAGAYGVTPGSPKYFDKDNNGVIDSEDMVTIAKTLPDFTYSWSNSFRYKDLFLNVLIVGVQGNDIVNLGKFMLEGGTDGVGRNLLNRWTPENENTTVAGHDVLGNQRNSSQWVENGSYLRVKNITFGYNLPSKFLKKFKINAVKVYVTGTNLLTFTNYSGFDPEANNASSIASGNNSGPFTGFDMASYPSQKQYAIGLDITF